MRRRTLDPQQYPKLTSEVVKFFVKRVERHPYTKQNTERALLMYHLYTEKSITQQAIANQLDISKQRVHQVLAHTASWIHTINTTVFL